MPGRRSGGSAVRRRQSELRSFWALPGFPPSRLRPDRKTTPIHNKATPTDYTKLLPPASTNPSHQSHPSSSHPPRPSSSHQPTSSSAHQSHLKLLPSATPKPLPPAPTSSAHQSHPSSSPSPRPLVVWLTQRMPALWLIQWLGLVWCGSGWHLDCGCPGSRSSSGPGQAELSVIHVRAE